MEGDSGRKRLTVIGAGNVATHLARALSRHHDVVQVWSRNPSHARRLAAGIPGCRVIGSLDHIDPTAHCHIIAVPDDAIPHVAARLCPQPGAVVHTSGSVPVDAIPNTLRGVFYPLQTFTRDAAMDMSRVPMLLESTDATTHALLTALARDISDNVSDADSAMRAHLHLAAVLANNFANHMWTLADRYLRAHTPHDITLLRPLLEQSLAKAMAIGPGPAQTGPAMRGDTRVMQSHIDALDTDTAQLYQLISNNISTIHHEQDQH